MATIHWINDNVIQEDLGQDHLDSYLKDLKSQNANLRIGDCVQCQGYDTFVGVYNGEKFLWCSNYDGYPILPEPFCPIELVLGQRFPIRYWGDCYFEFNLEPYRQQLLDNVKADTKLYSGKPAIYTHFTASDGKKYKIVYDDSHCQEYKDAPGNRERLEAIKEYLDNFQENFEEALDDDKITVGSFALNNCDIYPSNDSTLFYYV